MELVASVALDELKRAVEYDDLLVVEEAIGLGGVTDLGASRELSPYKFK